MTETPARKRRTFSAFGDVRRMPSEYEIVTHQQNWTLRQGRAAAFEGFATENGDLFRAGLGALAPFYERDVLRSEQAKKAFLLPGRGVPHA